MRKPGRNVEWGTPQWLFDWSNREYGPFALDAAAKPANAKCDRFFTEADDGLNQHWGPETVWCNPPYADCKAWVEKAHWESTYHHTSVVLLLPAYTGTQWWHDSVSAAAQVVFLRKKFKFEGAEHNSPFYCVLVLFGERYRNQQKMRFANPHPGATP